MASNDHWTLDLDHLGMAGAGEELAQLILACQPPYAICVQGKWGSGKAAVARLAGDVESYSLDNGGPPARLEDLMAKPGNASNWQGPYGKESDLKDPFGGQFQYKAPGEHGDFDITFLGKDHQVGGDGVNADWGNWQ